MSNRPSVLKLITRRALLAGAGTVLGVVVLRNSRLGGPFASPPPIIHPRPDAGPDGLANFSAVTPPLALPALAFTTEDGSRRTLADYRGQAVVLNFWATWCGPCVQEMPALQSLARALAGSGIVVLAVSADRAGAAVVRPFLDAHGLTTLPVLLDPQNTSVQALGLSGFPTTLLIGRDGLEHGMLEGSADWSAPAASALVRRVLG